MTKQQFLSKVAELYLFCNDQDTEEHKEDWTKPAMISQAGCRHLDHMLNAMVKEGVLTAEEHQMFFDNM